MDLAVVRGQCTATVKEPSLAGRRFALVQTVTPEGQPEGPVEVALDVTGAAPGQFVVLARGSAARLPVDNRQLATDLSVVAIVDEVTVSHPALPGNARSSAQKKATAATRTGGK